MSGLAVMARAGAIQLVDIGRHVAATDLRPLPHDGGAVDDEPAPAHRAVRGHEVVPCGKMVLGVRMTVSAAGSCLACIARTNARRRGAARDTRPRVGPRRPAAAPPGSACASRRRRATWASNRSSRVPVCSSGQLSRRTRPSLQALQRKRGAADPSAIMLPPGRVLTRPGWTDHAASRPAVSNEKQRLLPMTAAPAVTELGCDSPAERRFRLAVIFPVLLPPAQGPAPDRVSVYAFPRQPQPEPYRTHPREQRRGPDNGAVGHPGPDREPGAGRTHRRSPASGTDHRAGRELACTWK